jgi:hypothetical protein
MFSPAAESGGIFSAARLKVPESVRRECHLPGLHAKNDLKSTN